MRILHAALLAGMVLVGATVALMRRLGLSQSSFEGAATIGLVLAGAGFVLLAVATLVLRPRIPEPRPNQSADAYWMALESRSAALVLWCVVDGAGLVACVGYLLAGGAAPAIVGVLALVAQVLFRPSRLAAE